MALSSFILFCVSLVLTVFSARHPQAAQIGDVIVAELVSPFEFMSLSLRGGIGSLWNGYVNLIGVQQENGELRSRIATLESDLARYREYEHENANLKELLSITKQSELKGMVASVIGVNPSPWVHSLTIDRGISDGLKSGMAVIEGEGVVGQIIKVARRTSEVLLLTDHVSGVDSIVQRTRARGVVEGSGGELCRMRFIAQEEEVQVGDRVVTSGKDGVYPKGLLVGTVSGVDQNPRGQFKLVDIQPTVDFVKLERVLVLTDVKLEDSAGGGVK